MQQTCLEWLREKLWAKVGRRIGVRSTTGGTGLRSGCDKCVPNRLVWYNGANWYRLQINVPGCPGSFVPLVVYDVPHSHRGQVGSRRDGSDCVKVDWLALRN